MTLLGLDRLLDRDLVIEGRHVLERARVEARRVCADLGLSVGRGDSLDAGDDLHGVALTGAGSRIRASMISTGGRTLNGSPEERESPTWVAGVAEVSVEPTSGEISIQKLTIAMDMGLAINPDNVAAQIRGSALWGASQVLSEQMTMKNGSYEQLNFDTYKTIRLRQVPEIDVELVESGHHPTGVGEPASSVVAPAVANAVFNAVGHRALSMPIDKEALLRDMRKT